MAKKDMSSEVGNNSIMNTRPLLVRSKRGGFTLIELLVVIAIMLTLSGFLFPAVLKMISSAKSKRVSVEIHTIVAAVNSFKNEYGRWPGQYVQGLDHITDHAPLIHDLTNNVRNRQFIELDPSWLAGSGSTLRFVDAWGNDIYIALDRDGNGEVYLERTGVADFYDLQKTVPNTTAAAVSWGAHPSSEDSLIDSWGL